MHADDLVSEFHEAVNAGDADRLAALATEDIEVGGPRGRGLHLLRGWVDRPAFISRRSGPSGTATPW